MLQVLGYALIAAAVAIVGTTWLSRRAGVVFAWDYDLTKAVFYLLDVRRRHLRLYGVTIPFTQWGFGFFHSVPAPICDTGTAQEPTGGAG